VAFPRAETTAHGGEVADGGDGPLVSVGCAVYNGEQTLARALTGLTSQDYRNLEIIIADDCSTDASLEICRSFAECDPRIRIIRNEANVGLTRNMSHVFREARGKYFMWADQDDVRDSSFVRKTVAALESNPGAVLCQSLTGAFVGEPDNVVTITSLGGVVDAKSPPRRYLRFLRQYSDTTIYGLIRTDALRATRLWVSDLGSGNSLLFELLLHGNFIEIPEILYFYSGRGLAKRPSPSQEYRRANPGRKMPRSYVPFLVLARNQLTGIWRGPIGAAEKATISAAVCANLLVVNAAKLLYRTAHAASAGHVPPAVTDLCRAALGSTSHVNFVGEGLNNEAMFPKDSELRGR
jgi:glycosyltransferase involved in cell wall biosynthesis